MRIQMNKKIYFCGSIRGGRNDAELYRRLIEYMQRENTVLTEHIGFPELNVLEQGRDGDAAIYNRDIAFLEDSDIVIAECTNPSLGVGYELAFAEKLLKPCFVFYNRSRTQLSAMIGGAPYFAVFAYEDESEIYPILDRLLS